MKRGDGGHAGGRRRPPSSISIPRMRICLAALAALALLCSALPAQDRRPPPPRFRASFGWSFGEWTHETDGSLLDGSADAGMFRAEFEGTSRKGIGGGLRFEGFGSDDDLFVGTGFPRTEARAVSVYPHFTYRFQQRWFAMPVRVGVMSNTYWLHETFSDDDVRYWTIGPYFELAPEFSLVRSRHFAWSLYGEFGTGFGLTGIHIDGDPNDYTSGTAMFGLELGTRFRTGPMEVGLAYVGRFQSMAESDPEDGLVALGYDADFQGLLFTVGVVF